MNEENKKYYDNKKDSFEIQQEMQNLPIIFSRISKVIRKKRKKRKSEKKLSYFDNFRKLLYNSITTFILTIIRQV